MQTTDLFGHESGDAYELVLPETGDAEILVGWDRFKYAWKRRGEDMPELTDSEHNKLVRELAAASAQVIRNPASSLEAMRAKLAMVLCSGPDADTFIQHYVHGRRLPQILPFSDFATCQVFDVIQGIERLMAADQRVSH
jgi:hypothetical protein